MATIWDHLNLDKTPQSEPVIGKDMVPNSAGGFTFALDDWARLDRFLILGSEGGTYYATERKLTLDNADALKRVIAADGVRAVSRIAEISESGRAPKNTPAILALALCAEVGDGATKTAAYRAVNRVCRTGTHLFEFAAAKKAIGGAFGAGMRRAVGRWYTEKSADQLAYQVVKYRNRAGLTHRDLLRLARPEGTPASDAILRWCVRGPVGLGEVTKQPGRNSELAARVYGATGELPPLIRAFDELQAQAQADGGLSAADAIRAVTQDKLPWEALPSEALNMPGVWNALLPHLPMTAMVRNLATMTRAGVLGPKSDGTKLVCERLGDAERIRKARLHPVAILLALKTYASGRGVKSTATWTATDKIVDALDTAFYTAFDSVKPSGKRFYLGLDVSGSMGMYSVAGTPLTAAEGAAAMALVTQATEPACTMMGFSSNLVPIDIARGTRLSKACKIIGNIPMGATDCALPMIDARKRKLPVDVFAVYTDNETWFGQVHPFVALKEYRQAMGIGAKLVVVGMTATGFTIADPTDAGMLDVVGFDAATPDLISDFAGRDSLAAIEE